VGVNAVAELLFRNAKDDLSEVDAGSSDAVEDLSVR
jgi:hypothetical protein